MGHLTPLDLAWLSASGGLALLAVITLDGTTIIVAVIGLISTTLTLYFSYLMNKNTKATEETNVKVDEYHKAVNSNVDKLLATVEAESLAKGHLAGVEEERNRRSIQDADRAKGRLEATPVPEAKVEITKMPVDKEP